MPSVTLTCPGVRPPPSVIVLPEPAPANTAVAPLTYSASKLSESGCVQLLLAPVQVTVWANAEPAAPMTAAAIAAARAQGRATSRIGREAFIGLTAPKKRREVWEQALSPDLS